MKIETKHNLGDMVWAMVENRPRKMTVILIETIHRLNSSLVNITYRLDGHPFEEEFVFSTKEELLKSL